MAVTDFLRRHIQNLFAPERREVVEQKLTEASERLPLLQGDCFVKDRERVLCAILKLSRGDMERLDRHIGEAQRDWRDVLVAADFAIRLESYTEWDSAKQTR